MDRRADGDSNSGCAYLKTSWKQRINGNLGKAGKSPIHLDADHGFERRVFILNPLHCQRTAQKKKSDQRRVKSEFIDHSFFPKQQTGKTIYENREDL